MVIHVGASRLSRSLVAALTVFLLSLLLPSPTDASAVAVVYHGSRTRPYIALTIDDGYNSANCRAIADILKARNVPATFFPYSRVVTNAPSTWRHISAEGFRIANHSVSHPYMTRLSYASQVWQIRTARLRIETVIGRSTARLFRPPYGTYNWNTRLAAGATGMKYIVMWDTTFADTAAISDAAHFNHAMRGTKGSIILAHCGPASTVRIMARVVAAYRARGLRFVTVEQLLGLVPISPPSPSPSPTRPPSAPPSAPPTAPPSAPPTAAPTAAPSSTVAPSPAASPGALPVAYEPAPTAVGTARRTWARPGLRGRAPRGPGP